MSITKEAKKQLARLAKSFAPIPDLAGLTEIEKALAEGSSVAQVAECGNRLMRGHPYDDKGFPRTFFPNPAHVSEVYAQIGSGPKEWTPIDPAKQCELCHGDGFVRVPSVTRDGIEYEHMRQCVCATEAA